MTALNVLTGDISMPGTVSRFELTELVAPLPANDSVVWVFRDQDDLWCVRQEGGRTETFAARDKAVAYARTVGEVIGPHRLFLEGEDGRFAQEFIDPDCTCGPETGENRCACR